MKILEISILLNFVIVTLKAQQHEPVPRSEILLDTQFQSQLSTKPLDNQQLPSSQKLDKQITKDELTNLNLSHTTTPEPVLLESVSTTTEQIVTTSLPITTLNDTETINSSTESPFLINETEFISSTTATTAATLIPTTIPQLDIVTPLPTIENPKFSNLTETTTAIPFAATTTSIPLFIDDKYNNLTLITNSLPQTNQSLPLNGTIFSNITNNIIYNNNNSSNNNNNVQFLKPKSKFKCLQSSDCKNDGFCFKGACFCSPGFTGESCGINIDECRQFQDPCLNNGTCIDEINGYRCECPSGFKGDRCGDIIDLCQPISPCQNNATCVNLKTDYECNCQPGWQGKDCQININECESKPCLNNGTCYDLINDYRCDCGQSGFTGKNCQFDFDDCQTKPCSIGAKECVDLVNDFKCICHDGWIGKRCDEDIQDCLLNPCENNGTCIEKSSQISQLIKENHNNMSLAELITINSETLNISNVNINNVNLSMFAGYFCECNNEYIGDNCEEKKKCFTKPHHELCNHTQAECLNVGFSYECLINASFDGTGANYSSYKVNGEFKLKEIYIRYRSISGGIVMSFETMTTTTNQNHQQQELTTVVDLLLNGAGSYLAGQQINSSEPMKFDEYLDGNEREIHIALGIPIEIKSITLAKQHQSMISMNSLQSHPFKGCLMQVRLNGQLVPLIDYHILGIQNHTFTFLENHLELGQCRTCFEKDCLHGGHCEFNEGYDHCSCRPNYSGTFCEQDFNECETKNVCSNGATCENFFGGYKCNCKEGYKGEKCQDISDYCKAKQPCSNGGICKNINTGKLLKTSFECECPSTHIGTRCERRRDCLNECHPQHSRCINNETCACLPGKKEERMMCEYVSSCEQVQGELCSNGGTCRNLETGGFHCICPEPFYGHVCELIEKSKFNLISFIIITCLVFSVVACALVSLFIFRGVRKARATRGTYSPSTQEKFGNSASDLLKPPIPERLI